MSIFDIFKEIEQSGAARSSVSWLVVGLGNPGAEYTKTRHNAGFLFIDALAKQLGVSVDRVKFQGMVGECSIGDTRVLLIKPQTYMNESGRCVGEAASFYKIPPERVLVIHDDISLDVGKLRIRRKGSAGGHNGLKSLIAHLGSEAFPRIKIGVGKNQFNDLVDWVLGKFPPADFEAVQSAILRAISATEQIVKGEIEAAMNTFSK